MNTKTNSVMNEELTIEQIYEMHHNTVYNYVLSVMKNTHEAEEVCNNVFVKMHRLPCAEYNKKKGAALTSWIRTITHHQILDFYRTFGNKQSRFTSVSDFADGEDENKSYFDFVAPQNDNADQMILDEELNEKIMKAFDTLKPKYRKIANLYFLKELTYEEIAKEVDIPMGTVKGMLSRARTVLQDALQGVHGYNSVNVQSA